MDICLESIVLSNGQDHRDLERIHWVSDVAPRWPPSKGKFTDRGGSPTPQLRIYGTLSILSGIFITPMFLRNLSARGFTSATQPQSWWSTPTGPLSATVGLSLIGFEGVILLEDQENLNLELFLAIVFELNWFRFWGDHNNWSLAMHFDLTWIQLSFCRGSWLKLS